MICFRQYGFEPAIAGTADGMTKNGAQTLANVDLMKGIDAPELTRLERRCIWRCCQSGEQILSRDSDSRDVLFVVSGRLRIVNHSRAGREVAYATVDAGGYCGELAAIDGEPRSASVFAMEDGLLALMSPGTFNEFLAENAPVAMKVLRRLARIVRSCDERIMDLSTLGALQRVYSYLLKLAQPDPVITGAHSIYPMPTQQTIASEVGTTRETVARALSGLTAADLVERRGRTLYILDKEHLKTLAERLGGGERSLAR